MMDYRKEALERIRGEAKATEEGQLINTIQEGETASTTLKEIQKWFDEVNDWAIESIKNCPVKDIVQYRNMLRASTALKEYLEDKIRDGENAKVDLDDLNEKYRQDVNAVDWDSHW